MPSTEPNSDAASLTPPPLSPTQPRGSAWEVFWVFLRLGVTSFGGPAAHLGYFRTELVERRRWLSDAAYADLVALCQFMPGPASSQVGFGLGLLRAGYRGALAAFVAFTLPSAALLVAFAYGATWFAHPVGAGLVAGLKIVAVAIVAQAVFGMAKALAPDRQRAAIAVIAVVAALLFAGSVGQIVAIVVGAVAGIWLCRTAAAPTTPPTAVFPVSRGVGIACLALFALLLVGSPIVALLTSSGGAQLFDASYRAGSLVFGGGHVVLPLLEAGFVTPGWVSPDEFLAGYGLTQAMPGPLFTFAAYLGALSSVGPGGIAGAVIALAAIFLPGFLLLVGVLPFWNRVRTHAWAQALMRGAGAAVLGLLIAALYDPVFTSAVHGPVSFCLAIVCFVMLTTWKLTPWVVVLFGAVVGAVAGLF